MGRIVVQEAEIGVRDTVLVLFDEGENFQRCVRPVWERSRRKGGWPTQVRDIRSADSKKEPGMQAADLFAWAVNRHIRRNDRSTEMFALGTMRTLACIYQGNPDFRGDWFHPDIC